MGWGGGSDAYTVQEDATVAAVVAPVTCFFLFMYVYKLGGLFYGCWIVLRSDAYIHGASGGTGEFGPWGGLCVKLTVAAVAAAAGRSPL